MSRLNAFLALVLIGCALAVVNAQHRARMAFVELERLKHEARALDEQWGQLRLEQSTWANHARVEVLARTQLGLITPSFDRIRIETLPPAP